VNERKKKKMYCTIAFYLVSLLFFLSNNKKRRRKEREKKQRQRITPTSWSVVRYVVQGEVDKRYGIGWVNRKNGWDLTME
jgi:hypothetical protein